MFAFLLFLCKLNWSWKLELNKKKTKNLTSFHVKIDHYDHFDSKTTSVSEEENTKGIATPFVADKTFVGAESYNNQGNHTDAYLNSTNFQEDGLLGKYQHCR